MRRVLLLLTFAIGLAWTAHVLYYRAATKMSQTMLCDSEGEMRWLRTAFHLSEDQYSSIKKLHEAYRPECELNCRNLADANESLSKLIRDSSTFTPEIASAMEHCAQVQLRCRMSTLKHAYAVSNSMNPEDARRYRRMAEARIVERPVREDGDHGH